MRKLKRRLMKPMRDFALGLGMFGFAATLLERVTGSSSGLLVDAAHARLLELPPEFVTAAQQAPWEPSTVAVLSTAVAFAALVSLNMWFARHVREAYAARRRNRMR